MTQDLDALPLPELPALPELPMHARLYYTGLGARRYKRASVQNGPGEPLVMVSTAQEYTRRRDCSIREIIRAARREGYELAMSKMDDMHRLATKLATASAPNDKVRLLQELHAAIDALASQPAQEQINAQGKSNAELDIHSNHAQSQQRWNMACAVEMGQPMGSGKDSLSGDIEPQGTQHVATLRDIDEYGPMLDWHKHWVDLPIGVKLFVGVTAKEPQGQAVSDEQIIRCFQEDEDDHTEASAVRIGRAILALRDGPEQRVPLSEDWATIAGLESAVYHLSTLVDQQRALLAESEDVFGRDGHGGRYEDGECGLIDRIRAHLEMTAPPPNGITSKEQGNEN